MKSVEIYLPLNFNDGTPVPQTALVEVEKRLTAAFGGVTAHKRAPAEGRWQNEGRTQSDEIAIFEVVLDRIDRGWWRDLRVELEQRLAQEKILIVARDIEIL